MRREPTDVDAVARTLATAPGPMKPHPALAGAWIMAEWCSESPRINVKTRAAVGTNHVVSAVVDAQELDALSSQLLLDDGYRQLEVWTDGEGRRWTRWIMRRVWVTRP